MSVKKDSIDSMRTGLHNKPNSLKTAKYYDFDPFALMGVDPVPDSLVGKVYPLIEIIESEDSVLVNAYLNDQGFLLNRKLIKKDNYYYEEFIDVEHGLGAIYKRFYSKDKILEFMFTKDFAKNSEPYLQKVTSFTNSKKISITPNEVMVVEANPDYNIDTFPNQKIAVKQIEEFDIKGNCLLYKESFKSYVTGYDTVEHKKYCFNKYPFNRNRFSYYWYILLPDYAEAWAIRDILKKYSEKPLHQEQKKPIIINDIIINLDASFIERSNQLVYPD